MGGLGCKVRLLPGLPYGKLALSSKGLLVFAEKASRSASICACISGIGHEDVQFSKIRICRVKYSFASVLKSGSGDVSATYKNISVDSDAGDLNSILNAALCR